MRPERREPEESDFVPAHEYETSAPASFGLPELPVLYAHTIFAGVAVWIASNGVTVWRDGSGTVYELDEVSVGRNSLDLPESSIEVGGELAIQLQSALTRCRRMFGSAISDSIELAVPVDYETGDADDLGDARLVQSEGEGMSVTEGPAMAYKRRRSS